MIDSACRRFFKAKSCRGINSDLLYMIIQVLIDVFIRHLLVHLWEFSWIETYAYAKKVFVPAPSKRASSTL